MDMPVLLVSQEGHFLTSLVLDLVDTLASQVHSLDFLGMYLVGSLSCQVFQKQQFLVLDLVDTLAFQFDALDCQVLNSEDNQSFLGYYLSLLDILASLNFHLDRLVHHWDILAFLDCRLHFLSLNLFLDCTFGRCLDILYYCSQGIQNLQGMLVYQSSDTLDFHLDSCHYFPVILDRPQVTLDKLQDFLGIGFVGFDIQEFQVLEIFPSLRLAA